MADQYLNMIVEFGIFGIPAFLGMLFSLLRKEYKRGLFLEAALLIGVSGVIFFLNSYAKKFFWNVIMLLLIESAAKRDPNTSFFKDDGGQA